MRDKLSNPKFLAQLALLVAVELVMKITGLGSVPIGPIYMSFLTLPVAIGAILMGPLAGAILGGVFGIASFVDAISGASAMGGVLFQVICTMRYHKNLHGVLSRRSIQDC